MGECYGKGRIAGSSFPIMGGIWRYADMQVIFFQVGILPPVRFSGRAVIGGKSNTLPIFRGGGFTCASRGADYAKLDEKTKIRAGGVHPAVVVWRRGRQEADLQQRKNANMDVCVFSTSRPPATSGGCPLPL